jgi:hypothetical protein
LIELRKKEKMMLGGRTAGVERSFFVMEERTRDGEGGKCRCLVDGL